MTWKNITNAEEAQKQIIMNAIISTNPLFIVAKDILTATIASGTKIPTIDLIEKSLDTANLFIEKYSDSLQ